MRNGKRVYVCGSVLTTFIEILKQRAKSLISGPIVDCFTFFEPINFFVSLKCEWYKSPTVSLGDNLFHFMECLYWDDAMMLLL